MCVCVCVYVCVCENSKKGCIHNDIFTFESIISRLFEAAKDGMIFPFISYQQTCHKLSSMIFENFFMK